MNKARVIALYLPQFHPVKVNDDIWGKGFTEWTNVAKAKPLFKGHYQPQIPSDLGFYDLRLPEIRKEQAKLASEYGVEGFCYWHYWFGNRKRVLDMPFREVVNSEEPDFPFCLCWANETWSTSTWNNTKNVKNDINFLEQVYPGEEDYIAHFNEVLPAFKDKRYIQVDGKPLFAIHNPLLVPEEEMRKFIKLWNNLARENGLNGIHFVARIETASKMTDKDAKERINGGYRKYFNECLDLGFDAIWEDNKKRAEILTKGFASKFIKRALYHAFKIRILDKYNYKDIVENFRTEDEKQENIYPMMVPRWDRTPRQGKLAEVYINNTPELFKKHVKDTVTMIENKQPEHKIVFLQAWNEWGEGNYLEPDLKYGHSFLNALKEGLEE